MEVASLLDGAPAKRGRGRPKGATSAVVRDVRALGVHHVAFLRAALLGVDLRQAYERYLAFGETTSDLRHIEARRRELTSQLIEAGRRLDATLPPQAKVTRYVDLLRPDAPGPKVVALPSLDEWVAAEGMDPDMWSEAELLDEYRAAFALDNPEALEAAEGAADLVKERVRALNHLSNLLAVAPKADDKVDAWFARPVVLRLRNAGVMTLENLYQLVNVYGFRWYGRVKGFGARRAAQVVAWLKAQSETLNLVIRDGLDEPKTRRALRLGTSSSQLVQTLRFGLVPLERLTLPSALLGLDGVYRSRLPNSLEASDDLQAVTRWLSRYDERPATQRSYRKEVERFVLWMTSVQRKAVSSASALDCQAYRAFLQAVPPTWVNSSPVERTDPMWRPFRGAPSPASQKQALVIIQTMFEGLLDAGYLVANPMRAVMKGFALPSSKVNIQRSFGELEWQIVQQASAQLEVGPARTRVECVLELLVSSGIRLDELAKARRQNLQLESLPDLPPTWVLTVTGKRNKTRQVPLADEVVSKLELHARDGLALLAVSAAANGKGADSSNNSLDKPLIFALTGSVAQWKLRDGKVVQEQAVEEGGGALSAAGIYAMLKRFFSQAAMLAKASGLEEGRFEAASTHWLRHTFVRQALVDGAPLEVVSELAGHASIDTTSIYSSQELARKISTVRGLRRRT
jgi:site-specific recombinase XerD